ncbi:ppsD [Symbiodinium necroappetens]|uniref:PpsD protein n=1 Tax=Symbiodinium necroappetens TaxID=1628268 RepID=A0A813A3N5_9DINO|nr:ppsD [Symbiodinium necroappetens]
MSRGQEQRGRDLPPVSTGEFVKATSGSAAGDLRRPSTLLGRRASGASSSRAPGTPVPECILGAGGGEERSPVGPFEAETEPDSGSAKRPAELDAETLRDKAQGSDEPVSFDAMVMEHSEVLAAAQAREGEVHPLVKLQAQAAMDRLSGDIGEAGDHGTWDGRWPLPSRTEYDAFVHAGLKWPTTRDAFVVQAARKEYHWSSMGPEQKAAFKDAAAEAWKVWLRNEAVEVLSDAESEKVWATLRQRGELHKVLTPRFVYTDKNDGQRTQQNNLPLKASARLVVPGYKDITAYGLRKDAPTASRTSQHLLFSVAASRFQDGWRMGTADVKSAFMKGERYMEGTRELYVKNVEVRGDSPSLPVGRKLSRVLKGVFGLADAPREWFLRLRKSVVRRGWRTSTMDAATFFLWSKDSTPRLLGMLCSHVDDLLFCGGPEAWSSIRELGDELGFGSLEENTFVYCGKRVTQDLASGEVTVSMKEYHQNLKEVRVPSSRRRDPDASLTPGEHKQLRALVGSLQWLVAQVRFDAGFLLSALQAETPTVNTLLKISQLIKLFKETGDFELRFRPLDLRNAGILVVTDASLGNVTRAGAVGSQPLERVYSQSCYCVLLAEASLMRGEKGRFTVLDHRSHRLQRVCRSTFAAELLGVEEGTDAGQYCRGHVAELQGYDLGHRGVDCILDNIDMVIVTDAKDVYDKGNSDTPSYGSQKSLAFTVAWLRGMLGRGNTALRWTATENMFVDCGTKEMDGAHMRKILGEGEWSYRFDADLVKQTVRARAPVQRGPRVLSGQSVAPSDPVLAFLQGLSTQKGWHRRNTTAIQVAHGAKSYRNPEPRFSREEYPYRTTYGLFHDEEGRGEWRLLERDEGYGKLLKLPRTRHIAAVSRKARNESPGCSELVLSWLVEEAQKPFNLRDEPLIRIVLAKVGSEQHFLLVNMHHSVTDGRSLSILRQELTAFYNQIALKLAEAPKLPALSMQYADFAYCQRRWMAQGRLERELAYWRSQLQQLPALQLLTDFPRPPNLALDGGQVTFQLQPALANRLRSLARAKSVTLFALLLGLFALALSRWAGAQDLAIASPVGHRQGNAVEPLIGYFVNTVLFRVNLKTPCTFEDLLQRLRDAVVGAFQNSSAPYAKVLEAAELDPAAVPAMFVLQDRDETAWSMEGLRVEQVEIQRHAALFDVTCEMQEMPGSAGGLQGVLVYNKHLWTNSRAVRFAESLQTLALAVAEQPAVDLLQLAVLSGNDRAKVLDWGGHNRPVPSPTPLIKALKVQLLQSQHDIAVLSGDRSVTYAEFGARVTALALALREELSEALDSEVLVALLLPRSVDLAVAIWAVLSTGAAYVPIDPEYPPQRIEHILLSAGPQLALARKEHAELLPRDLRVFGTWQWPSPQTSAASIPRVEELTQAPPQGLAYVIYTSGSTGKPKGVAIEHRSAANMVQEQLSLMRITREDRVLQFFKPAFDGAVQEYLSTFLAGAALVLWGEDKEETFAEVLSRHRCTACTLTPSALSVLDPKRLPLLTKLAVAAEACPPTLVELWACQRRLLNAYGPSENTVVATSAELGASESSNDFILRSDSFDSLMSTPSRQHVPIGTPLGGVQCYVFEATAVKSLQAIGTPGELCLGGVQLARGYFGDAAKTAEKFVINPLGCQKMQRMYKTGDIVTWLPQGQLLYLGRNDEMVKLRGFRIELSEVEAALAALGAQAVAVAVNPVKDGLWAWVTPETLSPATLRSELLRALPQYMVPTRIAVLEKFPLTPNGKIDKARLLAENCSEAHTEGPIVGPQSPLEQRLRATLAKQVVLSWPRIRPGEGCGQLWMECTSKRKATAATVLGLETLGHRPERHSEREGETAHLHRFISGSQLTCAAQGAETPEHQETSSEKSPKPGRLHSGGGNDLIEGSAAFAKAARYRRLSISCCCHDRPLAKQTTHAGLTIPLSKLYELQTVRALADHLAMQEETVLGPVNEAADVESGRRIDLCLSASQKGCSGFFQSMAVLCWRLLAWVWISGVVIWPAMLPLKLSSQLARSSGAAWSLCFMVLVGYPLYLLLMILLVICTKWLLIGRYRAGACSVNSWAFLRWWAVDRMLVFVNELCLGAFRGGPVYFAYLRSLGLQAAGYCRIDTRHVSESLPERAMFDLISLGRCCVVAEGAKLRPAAAEAGVLQLRPLAFGDYCAVGENAVCTAGCAVGDHVTLQPLSMLSGRIGRTLPDGSVWKGALLVQSRQQPIRVPAGFLCHDLLGDVFALLLTLFLQTGCSLVAYVTFGLLAEAQGFGVGHAWRWQAEPEGYLFAATWLLFGPPVMASADVLLDIDLAGLADQVMASMGLNQWEFGLRLAGMVVVSFAVYGWSLTLSSAFLCRYIRGSRNLNSWFFQVRRVVLRLTFPRYPAQLAGTWAMSLYLRLLGGRVSLHATVAVSEPPLEPRKLHVGEGALLLTYQALGECEVGQGSVVGAGAVLLPHSQVEAGAVVGAMSVAGRPVRSGLQLVGNPGVIMRKATLEQELMAGWGRHFLRRSVKCLYPLVAPMFLQMLLLTTLLPAMYVLTVLLDMLVRSQHGAGSAGAPVTLWLCEWLLVCAATPVLFKPRLRHSAADCSRFSEQLNSMSIAIFMGMAFGSPFYNFWLKAMGGNVASDALLLTAVAGDYRALNIGRGASVDKEAVLSCRRLLPGPQGAGFYICQSRVVIGPGSSVSHSAAVVAGETGSLSTLAPLSAVAASTRLPAQTFAVGLPPQAFPWSKASLVKPSARPLPRELRPPILLPIFVSRAIGRMKVLQGQQAVDFTPLVTGSTGFLGRSIVAALLESRACSRVFCLVRAADPAAAQQRVMEAARKAGATDLHLLEAVPGDLQQRNFGRPLADVQRLAGRVTHVLHAAAKVNLTEPFELMKKDNVDATAHLLEFCCISRPKPFHHISTMGILTPDMLDRHGSVRETATLGDIRALPLYGTGDQANGYPQSKWLAEVLVLEAARQGLPCYIHRPGLIGGHSVTGAAAEDVFFHFLADVLKLRRLPGMEGRKFNVTPVDWVAKAIARIALPGFLEEGKLPSGSVFHPAAPHNAITTTVLAAVLKRFGHEASVLS